MRRLLKLNENFEQLIDNKHKDIEYKLEHYVDEYVVLNEEHWRSTDENYVPKNFSPGLRSEDYYPLPSHYVEGFFGALTTDKISYLLGTNREFNESESNMIKDILQDKYFDLVENVIINKIEGIKNTAKKGNNMKRLASSYLKQLDYVETQKQMETLLSNKMEKFIDSRQEDWSFEKEDDEVKGPSVDTEFEKFFEKIKDDNCIDEFFNADVPAGEIDDIVEFLYNSKLATNAYNKLEDAIEEAQNEWLDIYDDEGDNAPYGPGMSQKDFI